MLFRSDPGHGGKDPGALGKNGREKDINLNVALQVGAMIEKNHPNVVVVYTRKTDKYVTLQERPNIANKANGDLFISIHTNASESSQPYGAETFTLGLSKSKANFEVAKRENSVLLLEEGNKETYQGFDPTSPESYIMFEFMQSKYIDQSVEIASYIQNEFANLKRLDRGVRQEIFWVLHQVKMPSILVELGFMTNLNEEKYLLSSKGQTELSEAIYNGFNKYKHEYDKRTVNTPIVTPPAKNESKSDKEIDTTKVVQPKEEAKVETSKKKETKQDSKPKSETTKNNHGVVFKLQVFSSKNEVPKDNRDYKNLTKSQKKISFYLENGWYKYTCGDTSSYDEIVETRNALKEMFPDSFIIAFKDGKRISVQEARELIKK